MYTLNIFSLEKLLTTVHSNVVCRSNTTHYEVKLDLLWLCSQTNGLSDCGFRSIVTSERASS